MVYTFGLVKHANIRYRESLNRLSQFELLAMLRSLSLDCDVQVESSGGADFLTFSSRELTDLELSFLSGHSAVVFLAEKSGSMLRPLNFTCPDYLPEDLPEVLKYKGKTSVSFTRMMLNIALSQTPFSFSPLPLSVLDPMCGKGTTCFCALQMGLNAIGVDIDQKAIHEALDYFSRYLKYHCLKHSSRSFSETVGKNALPVTEYVFAESKECYQRGDTRFLRLSCGDTSLAPSLCRRHPVHLVIADFPYGIQHAPQFGRKPESFSQLLTRALPHWKKALLPGGALAVSFNTLTFPASHVTDIVRSAGFTLCEGDLFSHLRHEVEQAVVRDAVFAINDTQ